LYREGFEARVAYELADAPGWTDPAPASDVHAFELFMKFCDIVKWPPIQMIL
jgi:hypothetical protein